MNTQASFLTKHKIAFIAIVSAILIVFTSSLAYGELKKSINNDALNIKAEEKFKDDLGMRLNREAKTSIVALGNNETFGGNYSLIINALSSKMEIIEKNEIKKVKLAYTKKVIKNPKMEKGTLKVVRKGKAGEKKVTMKVTYRSGKAISREVASVQITKNPVNKITMEGTKKKAITSRGSMVYRRAFVANASAYWAGSCGKKKGSAGYGITSSGEKLKKGIVAVDPRVIPLGTWLYIEGYGEALAADTGSAIKGNKIDLGFATASQSINFGRKNIKVFILDRPRFSF